MSRAPVVSLASILLALALSAEPAFGQVEIEMPPPPAPAASKTAETGQESDALDPVQAPGAIALRRYGHHRRAPRPTSPAIWYRSGWSTWGWGGWGWGWGGWGWWGGVGVAPCSWSIGGSWPGTSGYRISLTPWSLYRQRGWNGGYSILPR